MTAAKNEAHQKQQELIERQGGLYPDLDTFVNVKEIFDIVADEEGYVKDINALDIGLAAMKLGAGRETKEDDIDYDVGVLSYKKVGDKINKGDILFKVYNNKDNVEDIVKMLKESIILSEKKVEKSKIILDIIT